MSKNKINVWLLLVLLNVAVGGECFGAQRGDLSLLPVGGEPAPIPVAHFPDRLHAMVFRNWNVVDVDRIAKTTGATPQQIETIATTMGLPPAQPIPAEYRQRMYITVIRRNWHLLPYDQLLELLDMSADELAFILREDDFLFVKLGMVKPKCEPIRYTDPNATIKANAANIKTIVHETIGPDLNESAEPRFQFIRDLSKLPPPSAGEPIKPAQDGNAVKPQFETRFIYSYFALYGDSLLNDQLDPFPDGLLQRLAAVGVDGVWLHIVLRDLAPGGESFPEFGQNHKKRLATLRKLSQRAAKHGIGIYLYVNEPRAMPNGFFKDRPQMAGVREGDFTAMCTSDPIVRDWISDSLAYVFKEVPGLAGVFTITASENLTNCVSHAKQAGCPHCQDRQPAEVIAEVNLAIRDGVHRSKPDAKVIVWDWGWNGHGDAADHIAVMPDDTWLSSVSEWGLPIERGGIKTHVGEYSISAVGPGPRAARHWKLAKERGLKTIAKVQFNNSWELAAVPYIPVLDLVAEHCRNLAGADVDGIMLSWTLGGYPSMNLEVAQRFSSNPTSTVDEVLREIATEHFGDKGAPHARAAWKSFSDAFREYPYDAAGLYMGPQLAGPSNPLFIEPSKYLATMAGFPYDDLTGWRGPYPPEVFVSQFEKVATGWKQGLAELHEAVESTPAELRGDAEADERVAEAALLHFESVVNQSKFVMLREQVRSGASAGGLRADSIAQMKSLAEDEIRIARRMFSLTSRDSRIGFEASNHYLYLPLDFVEKVVQCRYVIEQLAR
jgi:hypothetical protein